MTPLALRNTLQGLAPEWVWLVGIEDGQLPVEGEFQKLGKRTNGSNMKQRKQPVIFWSVAPVQPSTR
jgi:hypothetical protein